MKTSISTKFYKTTIFKFIILFLVIIAALVIYFFILKDKNEAEVLVTNTESTETITDGSSENTTETSEEESSEVTTESITETSSEATETQATVTQLDAQSVFNLDTCMVVGDQAFEYYGYNAAAAKIYAACVNNTADALIGVSNVYSVPVPTSMGIQLPSSVGGEKQGQSERTAINSILGLMNKNVHGVFSYDDIHSHSNEYVYFRTDHHWTALGAYYAYTSFCKSKSVTPHTLEQFKTLEFKNFTGSFYKKIQSCYSTTVPTDTVYAYVPFSAGVTMQFISQDGITYDWPVVNDVSKYNRSGKYGTFIAGDNPYTIINNPSITDGTSCIVIKESFGNAFVPFLVDHYSKIYILDYRYWKGNIAEFAKQNNVNDVVFVNNVSALRSKYLMGLMKGITG